MQLVSIQVAKPQTLVSQQKEIITAFHKLPIQSPIFLSSYNLSGDEQADLVHHGGLDKAICVYCQEHYAYWEQELARPLTFGAFGENFTIAGMLESQVYLGNVYQIGDALVQVSQPRQPCYKLAKRHNIDDLPLLVQQTGYTGYYFRVLKEGWIDVKHPIKLVEIHPLRVSISFANHMMYGDKKDMDGLRAILAVNALSGSWRETLNKRLSN
jgi:MOSC domain-containing protein YiiM